MSPHLSHMVTTKKDLDFMALCSPGRSSQNPSWLPDLVADGLPCINSVEYQSYLRAEHKPRSKNCEGKYLWIDLMRKFDHLRMTRSALQDCTLHGNEILAKGVNIGTVQRVLD